MYRIIELEKGKYEIWIETKDSDTGKRKRIVRRVQGRKLDAENLAADIIHKIDTGTYVKPNKTPLSEYLNYWLEIHKPNIAPSTFDGYERIIKKHLIKGLGNTPLSNLQSIKIQSYYADKINLGLSARTVQQHHSVLREALQHAVKWGLLAKNPADATTPPKPKRPTVKIVEIGQINKLLKTFEGHRDEHLITFALYTGMRQGEILALSWDNINLEKGYARITQTVGHIKGEFIFRQTAKTKRSLREVRLDKVAINALKKQKGMINKEKIKTPGYIKNNLVFPDKNGNPLDPSQLGKRFRRKTRNAGIDITFHGLRHTHATMLLQLGVSLREIQDRLGHENINITADTYSHITSEMQQNVVEKLNTFTSELTTGK